MADDRLHRRMQDMTIEQQFIDAYDAHADAIFRHCALRLGDRESGLELMQDTFIKAWEYVARGKRVENMRAFLYKIANNLIIDFVRRRNKRTVLSMETLLEEGIDFPSHEPAPDRVFADREVFQTLQLVEEPYRTAVIMRHIDGLPPREIAELLKLSANVVSVRIHRGMEQLTALLSGNA